MTKLILVALLALLHPVHVSLTSIDYVEEKSSFKVFVRLYYDDFLLDIPGADTTEVMAGSVEGRKKLKALVGKYLEKKLKIVADGKELRCTVSDAGLEANEIKAELEYGKASRPGSLVVRNHIMTELYGDMANMVIVRIDGYERGVKMTPELTEETFNIKTGEE